MAFKRKAPGILHLEPSRRSEICRNAAAARWGGVMSPEEAKKQRAENTRKWRAQKKLQESLALNASMDA
jgi:hypothetical protein